jgi:glycosyltransferase involved in cell wall biosynthesis
MTVSTRPASSLIGVTKSQGKLRICLIAQNGLSALIGGQLRHTGGIEWQESLMARWLVGRGHDVSMITWDEGQGDEALINGVRVLNMGRREAGIPGLRFVHPRWTRLCRALARADADVYYHNLGDGLLGQIVLWCRWRGRKSVYSVSCDPACDRSLPMLLELRHRLLYRYGLRNADRLIVQTQRQRGMLREHFGLESEPLPMPCEESPRADLNAEHHAAGRRPGILWIGRFAEQKRLEWLLAVAARMPECRFHVLGGPNDPTGYAERLTVRARTLPNVVLQGQVERSKLGPFYRQAACLLCTSAFEGFPNTFLEAWSHGVPVISTVDPDGVIARFGLGAVADTVDDLVGALRNLLASPLLQSRVSSVAREYYLANHALDPSMERFERVFREVVAAGVKGR